MKKSFLKFIVIGWITINTQSYISVMADPIKSVEKICIGNEDCWSILNKIPPVNELPKVTGNQPIPIMIVPYNKGRKYTRIRNNSKLRQDKYKNENDDAYLYE